MGEWVKVTHLAELTNGGYPLLAIIHLNPPNPSNGPKVTFLNSLWPILRQRSGSTLAQVVAWYLMVSLWWCHNGCNSALNHQPHDCFLNRLFRRRSKKTSKLRVTGLCAGNSPGTSEFLAQMASNAENVSIWWCHHAKPKPLREPTLTYDNELDFYLKKK